MAINENKYFIYDKPHDKRLVWGVKKGLNFIHNLYYKLVFNIIKPNILNNKKYKVSICAIFRDEADYLREWIEFHRIVGVEHFYLYNNFSQDQYLEILQPYIHSGIVTLIDWPIKQGQMSAYDDFFKKYSSETEWVGLIDLDEYLVINQRSTIYEFLEQFRNRPAVIFYWKVFGSSGKIHRDNSNLVTEDFVVCYRKFVDIGKFFFNTNYEYYSEYKHNNAMHLSWAKCKGVALPPVNVFDKVCTLSCNPVVSSEMPAQINHYLIKSFDEYIDKKSKRGGGVHDISMHNMDYFFRSESSCQSVDYSAYKYLIKLKLALGKKDE